MDAGGRAPGTILASQAMDAGGLPREGRPAKNMVISQRQHLRPPASPQQPAPAPLTNVPVANRSDRNSLTPKPQSASSWMREQAESDAKAPVPAGANQIGSWRRPNRSGQERLARDSTGSPQQTGEKAATAVDQVGRADSPPSPH
jgi:hypothetical protein